MNWRNCVQPIFGSAKFTNAGIAYDSRQHQHPRALTIPLSIASKETNETTDEFRRNDMREIEKKNWTAACHRRRLAVHQQETLPSHLTRAQQSVECSRRA